MMWFRNTNFCTHYKLLRAVIGTSFNLQSISDLQKNCFWRVVYYVKTFMQNYYCGALDNLVLCGSHHAAATMQLQS